MKTVCVLCGLVMLFSGCAIITSGPSSPQTGATALPRELQLKVGMSQAEVAAIMDRSVTVGFEVDPATGASKPIQARSLYSSEFLALGNKTYQVDKYIIRDNNGIAVTTEDLLFPVVFERGLLVAKGRAGLEQLKQQKQ